MAASTVETVPALTLPTVVVRAQRAAATTPAGPTLGQLWPRS